MADKLSPRKLLILRIVAAIALLACSEGLRRFFASFKKPPAKNEIVEKTFIVEALSVTRGNHEIKLQGYGVIRSSETVNISSEISGVIDFVNPNLEIGLTIKQGETLFKIDPKDYQLAVEREKARIATLKSQIAELETDIKFTEENVVLQNEEVILADNELKRQKELAGKGIGSVNNAETAQRSLINSKAALLLSRQKLQAARNRITTLNNQIEEAKNILDMQENNLNKCLIKSPQSLRVTAKNIEKGQLATPGSPLVTLESDEKLEIPVMIPGPEVIQWLKLDENSINLFKSIEKSSAAVFWIESDNKVALGNGILSRIENYNSGNRMVKGLVELNELKKVAAPGMFCRVYIDGKTLTEVYKVPRVSIIRNKELQTIVDGRLKIIKIEPVYSTGDYFYVKSKELPETVIVVNSKLTNPVENLKLGIEGQDGQKK